MTSSLSIRQGATDSKRFLRQWETASSHKRFFATKNRKPFYIAPMYEEHERRLGKGGKEQLQWQIPEESGNQMMLAKYSDDK